MHKILAIGGQREDTNGFMINGSDVKELMNGGTSVVPNLDSIAEFRILTNNFDAQYGNYSGGIVNVVTKSGSRLLHGSALEFLRNTNLDARNFFSPDRSFYRQNRFGGTVGGPLRKNKPYYTNGCASGAQCVFPDAIIPKQAWSSAQNLLQIALKLTCQPG